MATGQAPSNPVPDMRTYPPVKPPVVVIGPQYLAQYPVELTVSANDFKVADNNGTVIFQVKSKHLTLHGRRFINDAAGITLVNLKKKIITMHGRWEAFRGKSKEVKDLLFTVKRSEVFQSETELDVFLANNEGGVPDFKVKDGESSYSILLGGTNSMLAQMHRNPLESNFGVTVYPNVDYAFIIALVVILHKINADRNGEGGSMFSRFSVGFDTIASTVSQ